MFERDTTAGVVINKGTVLVARRASGGPLSEMWEFPGGKNRYGESIEDTLKREWLEELGIDVDVKEELLAFDFTNKETIYHLKCHLLELKNKDFSLNFHTDVIWADKEELSRLSFGPSDSKIRDYIISFLL